MKHVEEITGVYLLYDDRFIIIQALLTEGNTRTRQPAISLISDNIYHIWDLYMYIYMYNTHTHYCEQTLQDYIDTLFLE